MKRRTVSADDLETMAFAAHAPIEPPGPEGGWATATINGREYRARVGAAAVTAVETDCTCGGMAACQQCQDRDAAVAEWCGEES